MSDHQTRAPFYCLALLGATLLAMGALGAQNQKPLAIYPRQARFCTLGN